jgi:hypothetical protein
LLYLSCNLITAESESFKYNLREYAMFKHFAAAILLSIASVSAFADTIVDFGTPTLPTAFNYGNTFAASAYGQTFFDDYIFTVPDGSANSITSSVSLGSLLGIADLQARVYSGNTHETGPVAPGTLMQAWGTSVSYGGGAIGTTVILNPLTLVAGTYTLQIRGTVSGTAGGSYAGVLNLSPVPEADTWTMLLAGLCMVGFMLSRRREI